MYTSHFFVAHRLCEHLARLLIRGRLSAQRMASTLHYIQLLCDFWLWHMPQALFSGLMEQQLCQSASQQASLLWEGECQRSGLDFRFKGRGPRTVGNDVRPFAVRTDFFLIMMMVCVLLGKQKRFCKCN